VFNSNYPYTLTTLGQALGFKGWHDANKLLETIKNSKGLDIKSFDNIYHCSIMNGQIVQAHRYSSAAKNLLERVREGDQIVLDIPSQ